MKLAKEAVYLVRECVDRLTHVVLQAEVADRWVWKLHPI